MGNFTKFVYSANRTFAKVFSVKFTNNDNRKMKILTVRLEPT
jgi:hypothetical protein